MEVGYYWPANIISRYGYSKLKTKKHRYLEKNIILIIMKLCNNFFVFFKFKIFSDVKEWVSQGSRYYIT